MLSRKGLLRVTIILNKNNCLPFLSLFLKIVIGLRTIIVTLSRPFRLSIQDISINEVLFFAKSLIKNQIRLFRLYPAFSDFQTFSDFQAFRLNSPNQVAQIGGDKRKHTFLWRRSLIMIIISLSKYFHFPR